MSKKKGRKIKKERKTTYDIENWGETEKQIWSKEMKTPDEQSLVVTTEDLNRQCPGRWV